MGKSLFRLGVVAIATAALAAAGGGALTVRPERMHPDPVALQNGLADALRAFVAGDAKAARKALDAVEENCRRPGIDEEPGYPQKVLSWDGAFHGDLDFVREMSSRGRMEDAYNRFTFLPRGCIGCHADAVKEGVPGVPVPAR